MLNRIFDRQPAGSPLLCDAVLLTKDGEEITRKRIVYSLLDTDDMLLRLLNVTAKSKPHTLKLTLIVEWIDNAWQLNAVGDLEHGIINLK